MSFSISGFKSSFSTGVARPTLFRMIIPAPPGLLGSGLDVSKLSYSCFSATLPGRQIASDPRMITGPERKMGYANIYTDLNVGIICSGDMGERTFFDEWQNLVSPADNSRIGFYDDYVVDMKIEQFGVTGNLINTYRFEEAYPITVVDQDMNWSSKNTHLALNVTFAYRRWVKE